MGDKMKFKLIVAILILLFTQNSSYGQYGFTNKAEAKNTTVKGLKQGKWIEYRRWEGKWEICNEDSSDQFSLTVYKDDNRTEIERRYNKTGYLISEIHYINGKETGTSKYYYKDGALEKEENYINDKPYGPYKVYYQNGNLKEECLFLDGKIIGIMRWYYESGHLKTEVNIVDGKQKDHKEYEDWVQDGLLVTNIGDWKKETLFANGKKNGVEKLYYPGGQLCSEIVYENDMQKGEKKQYREKRKNMTEAGKRLHDSIAKVVRKEMFKELGSDLLKISVPVLQQASAYQAYEKNPNSQTLGNYTKIIINNNTLSPEEASKNNNLILEKSITSKSGIISESSAVTNGGNGGFNQNAGAAKRCADATTNEWKTNTKEYQNYIDNPNCNKMAEISKRKLAEMLLQSCRQYLPQSEIDGFKKSIISLNQLINGMPDCKTYNYGR